jgi:two-component system response regulator RegA
MDRQRYLVVDDDEPFRERLGKALFNRKLEVRTAASATEALTIAREWLPTRISLDLRMPGVEGLRLLEALREAAPEARVIVLTGYASIPTAMQAVRLGAHHYLPKPVTVENLLASFECAPESVQTPRDFPSLAEVEREYIHRVFHESGENVTVAAKRLGLHRRSLQRKLGRSS